MSALRLFGGRIGAARRLAACCERRQFSSTPARGVNSLFQSTENENLNAVLKTIQEQIIFVAFLPQKQKSLVFNPKKRQFLAQNPVIIEVEGTEYKFPPLDRFKDLGNVTKLFTSAVQNMKTPQDWANLATLLAGYKLAGHKINNAQWGKLVRLANDTGNLYTTIECAKQADKTGLVLSSREPVIHMLSGINQKITDSKWDRTETKQALQWAETVLDMLYRPPHSTPRDRTHDEIQFSPLIRSQILFARCCAVKVKQDAGEAVERDLVALRDEVALCTSLWQRSAEDPAQVKDLVDLRPVTVGKKRKEQLCGMAYVKMLAQIVRGMDLSQEIVGDEARGLMQVRERLHAHVEDFLANSEGSRPGWRTGYEGVLASAPAPAPAKSDAA